MGLRSRVAQVIIPAIENDSVTVVDRRAEEGAGEFQGL